MSSFLKIIFKGNRGFSLVEVMVATVVITIALIPMLGLITTQTVDLQYSDDRLLANTLTQQLAEQLRSNYDSVLVSPDSTVIQQFKQNVQNTYGYDCTVSVSDVVVSKIKKVAVTISVNGNTLSSLEFNVYKR